MSNFDILRDLAKARKSSPAPSAYDTPATVRRVEGDTAWVHIDGGVDETPVKMTIAAHEGDKVQVRVGGGTAWLAGNGSRPPTDDFLASLAKETADGAVESLIIQQAEIDRLKAKYIETLFISSPDYVAEDIPILYPSSEIYPDSTTWSSGGVNVLRGFAIDLSRGLILGAFYNKAIVELEARVAALEQRNSLSMSLVSPMMQTTTTDTEESEDELQ